MILFIQGLLQNSRLASILFIGGLIWNMLQDIVDKRRSLGISDTYLDENILDEYFIINVRDGDKIEVKLTKDNDELNYVRLEENAYLEFEAF